MQWITKQGWVSWDVTENVHAFLKGDPLRSTPDAILIDIVILCSNKLLLVINSNIFLDNTDSYLLHWDS
jgi:hypothetical protein